MTLVSPVFRAQRGTGLFSWHCEAERRYCGMQTNMTFLEGS
jgi:hypothetical protein